MTSWIVRGCGMLSVLPRPGEVGVEARVVGVQPIVGGVVDAAQRERRSEMVALASVVVDDVENDLEPGAVQALHHGLEFRDLGAAAGGGVAHVGREEPDRVVAPVVREPTLGEVAVDERTDAPGAARPR